MTDSFNTRQELRKRGQSFGVVILAGGLARRMGGQDKGLVTLAGRPMVGYALQVVLPLADQCVINANRNRDTYERVAASVVSLMHTANPFLSAVQVVADTLPGHLGPLAGLSAGIDSLGTDYVFMCPCDSPFLQAALVERLLHECMADDADIAVAHDGERLQPVFCVVNRRVNTSLNEFLASGQRKIDRWFETIHVKQVNADQYAASFVNVNTDEERSEAEQAFYHDR